MNVAHCRLVAADPTKEVRMIEQLLEKGTRVTILEAGKVVDEGIVQKSEIGILNITSMKLFPGEVVAFAFIPHKDPEKQGWRWLFKNHMTLDAPSYSQRGPVYTFEMV